MKLNKNKGKIHPSPSPSSSSSSSCQSSNQDSHVVSVLRILPAAIFALISVLSSEDREVLAYMITRSIKATANPSTLLEENKKKQNRNKKASATALHKPPMFDCGCFECYTSYWIRWDSSSHRELIHQAIEAFEEHLASTEQRKTGRGKRREKISARKPAEQEIPPVVEERESEAATAVVEAEKPPESEELAELTPEQAAEASPEVEEPPCVAEEAAALPVRRAADGNNRGFARRFLPDLMGVINSRLWNLWSPNE